MTMLKPLADNYNSYPRTMIRLSEISYQDMSAIPAAVQGLGLEVVWGPAELVDALGVSYSLMFVCRNAQTGEYTVVIRGTDFESLESWIYEDFEIKETRLFNQLAPHAPASALIALGTFNGLSDLLELTDPTTGESVVPFLLSAKPKYLYVTGHSLGGTLAPPMFACLNDVLYGGGAANNMALWTFAGLTPGNAGFNTYFNGLFNAGYQWRLINTLDVAPFCWWSATDIENIYKPYGLRSSWFDDVAIRDLFSGAAKIGYAQPTPGQPLPGVFKHGFVDGDLWVVQVGHQHSSATYQTLVDQAFPVS
jgi:hypothetical protein